MFKQVAIFLIILESIVSTLPDNFLTQILYYEIFKAAVRFYESFQKAIQKEHELQTRMTKRHVDYVELSNTANFYDSDYYYDFGGLLG